MKTFGLWMALFAAVLFVFTNCFVEAWTSAEVIIESTLFSYILYRLIKDELKNQ